jgi:hypothetical protein
MAFTVGDLINRTFDLLLQAAREERNQLTASIDAVVTTFNVNYALGALQRGTYLAIDDEVMYVWATTPGSGNSSTVTVQRADKGTAAAAHAANSIIQVNPYFTKYSVRKTLQDEIRSWGPQVFQVKTTDINAVDFIRGYDLGIIGTWFYILGVSMSPDTLTGITPDNLWPQCSYTIDQSANLTKFPSGSALFITDPLGVFDTPRTIHVTYAAPIDVDTTFLDTDLLSTMGIDNSEMDIAPYGAAWRLAAGREVRRMLTEAQGQVSDLANFPAGYQLKAAEGFKQLRDSRLQDAVERLRSQYPIRRVQ